MEDHNAAKEAAEKEVDNLAEESSVSPEDKGEVVDLTGSQEIERGEDMTDAEVNQLDAETVMENEGMLPPNSVPEILKTSDDPIDDDEDKLKTPDLAASPASETVVQNDKHAQELPITHLKNLVNNRVFEATPMLLKQRSLRPCDEDGKLVYDHRCFH